MEKEKNHFRKSQKVPCEQFSLYANLVKTLYVRRFSQKWGKLEHKEKYKQILILIQESTNLMLPPLQENSLPLNRLVLKKRSHIPGNPMIPIMFEARASDFFVSFRVLCSRHWVSTYSPTLWYYSQHSNTTAKTSPGSAYGEAQLVLCFPMIVLGYTCQPEVMMNTPSYALKYPSSEDK